MSNKRDHSVLHGRVATFAEQSLGPRIRLLAPLAFLSSPRIIAAIVDGTAPADLTVTGLVKALPYSWADPLLLRGGQTR
jgi:site-specific DNA recombinase